MTTWTTEVINKYRVNSAGRTSYESMTGHKCNHLVVGFGEKVWYKLAKSTKHDFETDWNEGYFVGIITHTTEYLVINKAGVFKCPTIRRLPDDVAYDAAILDDVTITYAEYFKGGASTTRPTVVQGGVPQRNPDENPMEPRNEFIPRRIMMRQAYFEEFGRTTGCPGCIWLEHKIGKPRLHSEACRDRITDCISKTESGKKMLERA